MKQIIFNVGGALSSYIEFDDKKLLVDIGKSQDFNPISDFLNPLFIKRNNEKSTFSPNKFKLDQLVISHPHNDHISSIKEFDDFFHADLLTCPNDNDGMPDGHKINWELFEESKNIDKLKEMLVGRTPPLRTTSDQNEFIYYIPPEECEDDKTLSNESYCNNISIVVFLIVNQHRVFFPADIQKEGMKYLLDNNFNLRNKLKGGVDVLVAPHHGLRSSFSTQMFGEMKNGKTNCLNVVSEKVNTSDNREVDTRYSTYEYCEGKNNIGGDENHYQVKTSRGHILIDYNPTNQPTFEIITDTDELIEKFNRI
ncbi:MBL fold metallo-hydrolase [uncultured Polaribacter sp.]|uniref:MBL fold metallo-hydrolase n=1 Tax=uncultured Polaribacter sp. TaxID=174711 RepID=UPI002639A346|nr:MBL fold metallo-hydrolase [uncultured Polaribacter sp.]